MQLHQLQCCSLHHKKIAPKLRYLAIQSAFLYFSLDWEWRNQPLLLNMCPNLHALDFHIEFQFDFKRPIHLGEYLVSPQFECYPLEP